MNLLLEEHNPAFPLGYSESYGYKSKDGSVIYQGEKISQGEPCHPGDVITVIMEISPPRKQRDPTSVNPGSTVYILKNGRVMFKGSQLKQTLYCFGVSCHNYGQVEVMEGNTSLFPMPVQVQSPQHYYMTLN